MEQFVLEKINNDVAYNYARYDVIERFPKEFKKNWLKSIDYHFLIILVITFFISTGSVSYFSSLIDERVTTVDAQQIQEKYVRILELEQYYDSIEDVFNPAENNKGTHLFGVSDNINQAAQGDMLNENMKGLKATARSGSNLSDGNASSRQNDLSHGFDKNKSSKNPDINSMGILSYFYTDDNISNHQGIDDLLGEDDAEIFTVLDEMDISNFSANGSKNEMKEQFSQNEYQMKESKIKRASITDAVTTIFPERRSISKVIKKNIDWEEIPTTQKSMSPKRIKSGNGAARSPDDISRILASHNRAIQDCYKQALKENQNLKGKIVVRFSVTPEGEVQDVKIIQSSLENEEMEHCIITKINRWNDFGYCDPELGISYYKQTYVFGY